ncbi:hypothetical protein [Breznakiella homolactica]|uniref:GerMN domain-containing protein n=1 Tax=Breznakiella homolactica TaxID=2798577 RepID=A0A7T7XLH4_9SPIR|nr:hypothetical protein [Breznakiella homolactica]QQO08407.1 hypothetical protein JFL75_15925 [Breznakiella homolactica]
MSNSVTLFFKTLGSQIIRKPVRRLLYLCVLGLFAFCEFLYIGSDRRTFVFYTIKDSVITVEDRMIPRTGSKETDIRRYAEETLLGPISLDSAPLIAKDTTLESLLFRDGVVYADLSEQAALPPLEGGGDLYHNLYVFNMGIRRNFSYVRDVRLFIAGNEAFPEKFRALSLNE